MSFKELGNFVNQVKSLKKLNPSDLNMQNELYKNFVDSFANSGLNASQVYDKILKNGGDYSLAENILQSIGLSDKVEDINKQQAYDEIQKRKKKISSSNKVDTSDLSKVSSEAQATKEVLSDFGQVNLDNVNSSASKLGETFRTGVTNGVEKAKSGIKSLGSNIKSVLSGLSATLKSYLPLLAVLAAFEGIKAIHSNIQSQRKDELNAGQKNLDKYNKKIDKNNDKVKQAKKLQEEFNTLSSGVDSNTNENIGLSTSQYERYLAIKKELVKLNGDLVTGYNSEGEALINNNTAIQDTIDKYQKLADQSKKDIASKKNVSIQNDSMALKAQKSLYGSTFADESLGTNLKRSLPYTFRSAKNLAKDGLTMNEASVRQSLYSNTDFQKQAAKILGKEKVDVSKLTSKQIQELANNADTFNSEGFIGKNDTKNLKKLLAASKTNYDQLQKYSDSFRKNTLSNISQAVDGYDKLDQTTKTFASNFISNMDIDPSKMLDTDYLDKQEKTVENLTKKLTQNKDVQDQIKDFQKTQVNGKMNANKWQQNVNDQFTALQKSTGIDKDTLALTLGVKLDDKENVLSSTGKDIAKMQETLNDTFKNQDISKFTDSLNLNDLSNAFDIVTDKTNIFTGSVDQLKERLKMLNSSAASASYTVEGYKAALDTDDDDSAYNTLVSGMKQTKEEYDQGKVGTDQFKTFAGMMSPTGKTDAKNFKENYDNLKKYFTEDNSGVYTFFDDLKTKTNDSGKALADFDKKTQKWKINIDSTASAAKKFGMGVEPFEALLNNLKTYGFDVNFSSLTKQYEEAQSKLDGWAETWQKNGGTAGDEEGQRIEAWRQQIDQAKEAGKEIPDTWTKVIDFEVNISSLQSQIKEAKDEYKAAQLNGDTEAQQKSIDKQLTASANIQAKLTGGEDVGKSGLTKGIKIPVEIETKANGIQNEIQNLVQQYQSASGQDKIKLGLKVEAKREELLKELQPYLDPETLKILGDNSDAKKKAKETKSEADKVPKEKKTTYTADASGAKKGAEEAQKAVNSVEDEHVTQIKTQYGIGKNGKVSQKSTSNMVKNNYLGNAIDQTGRGAYTAYTAPKQSSTSSGKTSKQSKTDTTSSKSDTTTIKVNVKGNAKKTIDSIKKSLSGMKSKSISIKVKGNAKKTISSISKSLKKLKSKRISIKVKGNASSVIKKITNALKKLKNKKITVKVKDNASHKISSIKGKLNALGKMHPTPKVTINTSGLPAVEAAKSAINGLHDKSVNVSVNYSQSGKPSGVNGAHGIGLAHGSMAWSKAFSQGTISNLTDFDDWNGNAFAHGSVKKLSSRALASGNLGADYSGTTLTSELGPELLVRGNRWTLLGENGAQFTNIKRGDIVFNHQQTADLLSKGSTNSRASIKGGMSAFAHGTAFASGHRVTGSGAFQGGAASGYKKHSSGSSSTKKHTSSTKRNTKATDKNTSSKKKNTKATNKNTKKKLTLAKLIDSVGKQFDFIAIKLDRASAATEKFANMINDYVKSDTKTKALWNQYKSVGTEISTNKKAASKYKSEASSFASKAIKKAPKTKSTSKKKNQAKLKKYFARVRSGSININTISNDNMRSAVEHYQELYEKYLSCTQAAQQLKNTQRELFNQWLNMPIEKAQKAIDNRANIYNYYSARGSAASTGESGVNALRGVYGDEIEANEKNVKSKTSTRDKAKRSDDAANKNLKKAKSTQTKAKKTKTSKAKSAKKAIKSQKGLSRSKKKSLNSKISKGQKISTKGLKGKTKKKAQEYNASVDAKKKADKNVKSKQSTKNKTSKNLKTAQSNLNKAKSEYKAAQALQNEAVTAAKADLPAYSYQNDILKKQVELKEADYKNQREAQKTAQKNHDKYQKELNSAKSAKTKAQKKTKDKSNTVKKKGKKILSRKSAKKLTGTQKKQIKSGKKVSTKGVNNKKLLKQLKDYNKAVEAKNKAKKAEVAASKKVTSASIKERDAQNALTTADNNAKQAAAELAQEKVNAAMQSQANIKAYYDAKQNYESIQGNNASSAAKLKQAKGEDLITEDYQKQIDSNEKQAQLYEESAKTMQLNLDEKVKAGDIKKGSQEWMQMQGEIDACTSSANDLRTTNEELKNSMRDDIYYRGFERAIKAAQNLQNSLTTISSLIDEDAMFDDDGNLTDYGTAAIATNIANVKSEKEELNQLMQERAKMAEHRDEYSDTEWADAIQKSDQDIADAVKSIKSAEDSVTTILKNNAKQKLDAINKTISAYSEAIKKSNDYYTYDKQLKSSNKDIQILRSQINALNGVSDAASRAKKARLEAELQEKQDALDDTVKDHIYNLQIDGLDKLSTQLNDDYEKYCKELSSSVDKIEKTFISLSGTISSEGAKIDSTITTILGHYGVKPSDLGLTDSKVTGYAQGGLVKSVHKNGDDGLASLAVGEEVATVDVVNLANKIRQDKVLNALANGHTLNGMTMDGIGTTEINVNFGEAIGAINVPSGVSEEELQRIVNESYKYTSQKVTRDMAKIVGRKRPV
ncbi:hypothetical protein [Anaerostipes sp. Marseille-Q3525]|uniref:hypothetical protein n=1 Tax=Anaerostipes sp. Marseille-Q3525 TaxID=2758418 RepID=UPI001BA968D3|nr:hypothetical protein [Anaerostipes sp. Marseille-Q3525]MBR9960938.1 hypothetical protein [Anaerostipes sp. Marseille-Q3525]